jgi:hypothetical protein
MVAPDEGRGRDLNREWTRIHANEAPETKHLAAIDADRSDQHGIKITIKIMIKIEGDPH